MLGPNAQGEWRAATVKLRLVNKQYAVDRGSSEAWRFVGREPVGDNFRVARDPLGGPGAALFRQLNGKHIVTVMHDGLVHCDSRSGRLDCECPERARAQPNRSTR